jgi:transposase
MSCAPKAVIGCDVGKTEIVTFDSRTQHSMPIANTPQALADFAASLDPGCLVVCEATGGYEAHLLAAMAQVGQPVHRADPSKVKAFIRSLGRLGKTDRIDARGLTQYGLERYDRLARWQPAEAQRDRLRTLVMTRRDLVATRLAMANRLDAPIAEPARPFIEPVIATFDQQIQAIDRAIAAITAAEASLAQAITILRTIGGIGPKTAAALVALMPELGRLDRRRISALAGLAPHPRQSGSADKYRRVHGGRPEVKRVLFMAALVAARHNPALRQFYQRLLHAGKKPMVALVAVMRKLIVICNARLREAQALA